MSPSNVITPIIADLGIDTDGYRLLSTRRTLRDRRPDGDAGLTGARSSSTPTAATPARRWRVLGQGPVEVDRSAAYALRWVARSRCGQLASKVEVQVAYAIGKAEPVGLFIETSAPRRPTPAKIAAAISETFACGRPRSSATSTSSVRYAQTAALRPLRSGAARLHWSAPTRPSSSPSSRGLDPICFWSPGRVYDVRVTKKRADGSTGRLKRSGAGWSTLCA